MVLLYTHTITARLQYICSFIFKQLLAVDYRITDNEQDFLLFNGLKINYSKSYFADSINIEPHGILYSNQIIPIEITCFNNNNRIAFFKSSHANSDIDFDVLGASFYLITRYEEYLPHPKDEYGRFAHTASLAFKEGFLQTPLVNIWVNELAALLQKKFARFQYQQPVFAFLPTYDIDIAYSYKYKGIKRNLGGFLQHPSLQRLATLLGLQKDPFDTYALLQQLHNKYQLQPIYFFLMAQKNGRYDKNILPDTAAMQQLILQHQQYSIGIHPSWQSVDDKQLLQQEKQLLSTIANQNISTSRQHYIRFSLPDDFDALVKEGITHDYSMGYGSINGFRASVATSFFWYNLQQEKTTNLLVHPFCYMDANSFYEQKLTATEAFKEMMYYFNCCKAVGGNFISIWHNHFLGSDKLFKGWAATYIQFLTAIHAEKKINR
jgi:hypothetical protein